MKLTAEHARELFDYDPETGALVWKRRLGKCLPGTIVGWANQARSSAKKRLVTCISGRTYQVHRLIWVVHYGRWPSGCVDHINGDSTDNRLCNLRDVTNQTNQQNRLRANHNNPLGVLGVRLRGGKFRAHITLNGKAKYLGSFLSAEAAHAAYLEAKRKLHEGCTI